MVTLDLRELGMEHPYGMDSVNEVTKAIEEMRAFGMSNETIQAALDRSKTNKEEQDGHAY